MLLWSMLSRRMGRRPRSPRHSLLPIQTTYRYVIRAPGACCMWRYSMNASRPSGNHWHAGSWTNGVGDAECLVKRRHAFEAQQEVWGVLPNERVACQPQRVLSVLTGRVAEHEEMRATVDPEAGAAADCHSRHSRLRTEPFAEHRRHERTADL